MAASATGFIELYNDIVNGRLIVGPTGTGWDSTPFELSKTKIYQGSKLPLRWYPIKPSAAFSFVYVDLDSLTLDIAIGARAGAEAILARQNVWTVGNQYLEGTLNLNTTEMNTAVGSSDAYSTFFEISLSVGGDARPVYQESISILSVVIGPAAASALPAAAVEFLTREQQDARYVKWSENTPGNAIELKSPDSTKLLLVGVNNDGSQMGETSQ